MALSALRRNNVQVRGAGPRTLVFAHGLGCDQNVWRRLAPRFERDHRIVLFDYVGSGGSDRSAYDANRYGTLEGYAQDLAEVVEALDLKSPVLVAHSISSTIGLLAVHSAPALFDRLVFLAPSPRFLNDPPDYVGGLDQNFMGWAETFSSLVAPDSAVAREMKESFCSTDPRTIRTFAELTLYSDVRKLLPQVDRASLILQCSDDSVVPLAVGEFMQRELRNSTLNVLEVAGHCPHLSDPAVVEDRIRPFLSQ
jgi:sigma-B regulation protein RsbQ